MVFSSSSSTFFLKTFYFFDTRNTKKKGNKTEKNVDDRDDETWPLWTENKFGVLCVVYNVVVLEKEGVFGGKQTT